MYFVVFVKYGSDRTLSVSFVKVDINKWDLCCTADVQPSPTTHIKRKTGVNCYDVDMSVLLQLLV